MNEEGCARIIFERIFVFSDALGIELPKFGGEKNIVILASFMKG